MKHLTMLFLVAFSINVQAEEAKVLKVVDQEGQYLLLETSGKYDDIKVRLLDKDCSASVKETVGRHSVVKIHKNTIQDGTSQKTTCEVNQAVDISSISLVAPQGYQYNQIRFYLGAGISFGGEETPTGPGVTDVDTYQYNYSVALYKQIDTFMIGAIYQVHTVLLYGLTPDLGNPSKTIPYDVQSNDHLIGLSMRKLFGDVTKSSTYIKGDLGFSWVTMEKGAITSPGAESLGSGVGANLGFGVLINTGHGDVDLGISQNLRTNSESDKVGTYTNLSIGYLF